MNFKPKSLKEVKGFNYKLPYGISPKYRNAMPNIDYKRMGGKLKTCALGDNLSEDSTMAMTSTIGNLAGSTIGVPMLGTLLGMGSKVAGSMQNVDENGILKNDAITQNASIWKNVLNPIESYKDAFSDLSSGNVGRGLLGLIPGVGAFTNADREQDVAKKQRDEIQAKEDQRKEEERLAKLQADKEQLKTYPIRGKGGIGFYGMCGGKMPKLKMGGNLSKSKAKEMLHDKTAHGKPLTNKQRKYFGYVAFSK